MSTIRLRSSVWFASGVVMSLLVVAMFQAWSATAAPGDDDATFFPIEPCRLFDYRPAPNTVGTRTAPLGPAETTVQQVTGAVGNCNVPAHATGVAMNVTITQPTAASFLAIFPANVTTVPTVSSLNWLPGQSPTPNKVDVKLSPAGAIKLHNAQGSVFVLADVVGFYSAQSLANLQSQINAINRGAARVPSGATVIGFETYDTSVVTTIDSNDFVVRLPARARVALTDDKVNFALSSGGAPLILDGDPNCAGTLANPTAPAGKVCLYLRLQANMDRMEGQALPESALADIGFRVRTWTPGGATPGADQYVQVSWAYHAP